MKIFVVNYDLRNARDYNSLYNRLNTLGGKKSFRVYVDSKT